jgi:hypothetical protein
MLHPYANAPTREQMQAAFDRFPNPDGNFIRDFQTTGFDARVWELYLFAWGDASGYHVSRPDDRPDFLFEKGGQRVWVEAVTANPTPGVTLPAEPDIEDPSYLDAVRLRNHNYVPIKLGSPLYSKLQARYWELPHVAGLPFVLAIEDFHDPSPFRDGSDLLARYLYGQDEAVVSARGEALKRKLVVVREHRYGAKVVPSGFFTQPGAEHVSAVLFSNSGTAPKFARMGYDPARHAFLRMVRWGTAVNHEPDAVVPLAFAYVVGDGTHVERWGEGLEVFHNPRARIPLPENFFHDAAEHTLGAENFVSKAPRFHPFASVTIKLVESSGKPFEDDTRVRALASRLQNQLAEYEGLAETRMRELLRSPDQAVEPAGRVNEISRATFDTFKPSRGPMVGFLIQERAWFADQEGVVIGAVTFDVTDRDWGYVVLGRDDNKRFRAIALEHSLQSPIEARSRLLARMEEILASGETTFEQD